MQKISFTSEDCKQFDHWATEIIGIPSIVLMENAGSAVANEIYNTYFSTKTEYDGVFFFCGTGNNGGDGLVAARHLFVKGVEVEVYIVGGVSNFTIDTELNFRILRKLGVEAYPLLSEKDLMKVKIPEKFLLVDAIFGTGINRDIIGLERKAIDKINKAKKTIISLDAPSGLNVNDGSEWGVCVKANHTISIASYKKAFELDETKTLTGEISTVDIGINVTE